MKVLVLAGGISSERDVSIVTGYNVYEALKAMGHETALMDVYLGHDGESIDWSSSPDLMDGNMGIKSQNANIEEIISRRSSKVKGFFGPGVLEAAVESDIVFMGLHGENGENGKVQACFDLMGIKYTGTDYFSSAIAMNKEVAKELMVYHGIPTPQSIWIKKGDKVTNNLGYPCVVKACSGGSSVGVSIAANREEFEKGLEEAFSLDEEVVVERYIKGREFSVCVMEGKALPVIEIAPKSGFYDYRNKYQAGSCVETCPADISAEKTRQMQELAQRVFEALRLKNYARMDFLMDDKGDIYCLEANTLPGMTATSLVPQEAAAAGMDFNTLVGRIIDNALHKHE